MRNRINVFKRRHGKVEHQVGEKTRTGSLLQRGALVDLTTSTILAIGIYKKKKDVDGTQQDKKLHRKGHGIRTSSGCKVEHLKYAASRRPA